MRWNTRVATSVCHSWPFSHFHQALYPDPAVTLRTCLSFLVGCHSAATSGQTEGRSLNPSLTSRPEHTGHPDPCVLLLIGAFHSCPTSQTHQALKLEWGEYNVAGFSFKGDHCSCRAGSIVPLFSRALILFLQDGHPVFIAVRKSIRVSHSRSHTPHNHHARFLEPGMISSGPVGLRVGCHSAATPGNRVTRSLKPGSSRWFAQKGHPAPLTRFCTIASHSCPHCPSHHTFLPDPLVTESGVRVFLVGCHSPNMSMN